MRPNELNALFASLQALTGIRIVKGFCRETAESQRFARFNEASFGTNMKSTPVSMEATTMPDPVPTLDDDDEIVFESDTGAEFDERGKPQA